MSIPKIIHQCWKTSTIPKRWRPMVASVKKYHPGWEYKLWTDDSMEQHVKKYHPELYPVYMAMELNIMRADVFRYVIMHDQGGMYCDLDYEFIRPYDYSRTDLVLPVEFDPKYGDMTTEYANYIFASIPKYPMWDDVLKDLINNPPVLRKEGDVVQLTGPGFLTRIFLENQHKYQNYRIVRGRS